jgi:hypothetical protein
MAAVVGPEDVRPTVAAAGDVIDGVFRKIDPWWARHRERLP